MPDDILMRLLGMTAHIPEGRATFDALVPNRYKQQSDEYPVVVREDCQPNTIYFMPHGSRTWNAETGETTELAPGYYVNPKQLGVIKNVT